MDVPVNYLAVLVAAISNMVIGGIWFGPLFGKMWMQTSGVKMGGKNPTPSYIIAFVFALIAAYVMAHFVWLTAEGMGNVVTIASGATTGFWAWLGLVAPATSGMVTWEGRPWSYWFIVAGYWLVSLAAMGAIIAAWQ
jgi:hypothetical protein